MNRSRFALITPKILNRPTTGFELRLFQLQMVLKRVLGEDLLLWDLSGPDTHRIEKGSNRAHNQSVFEKSLLISRDIIALGLHLWPKFVVNKFTNVEKNRILEWIDHEHVDTIFLVHPYSSPLLPFLRQKDLRIFVDCQNVESDLVRQMMNMSGIGLTRLNRMMYWKVLERWEQYYFPLANEVWLPSLVDCRRQEELCRSQVQLRCIPNALDVNAYKSCPDLSSSNIILPAYFGHPPNVEGAKALSNRVLPHVRKSIPGVRLILLGSDPTNEARALEKSNEIVVTGRVPDTKPILCGAGVIAVPILHGGGTRYKILEALALGLPVVTTSPGCEGLDVRDGEHLLVRSIDHFAEAIVFLLSNPAQAKELGRKGRKLIEQKYSWEFVEKEIRMSLNS